MSHDRGCPCGKDRYEYEDCKKPDCPKKQFLKEVLNEPNQPVEPVTKKLLID